MFGTWRLVLATLVMAIGAGGAVALAEIAPPKTVTGSLVPPTLNTPKPGTVVPSSTLGERVFVNNADGFALTATDQAQLPAATTNGGTTWKIVGPALHVDAAQAPLVVSFIGAANVHTLYAYGGGQAVDVSTNGGKTWYRALFPGLSESVAPNFQGHLVAYEQLQPGSPIEQYVSKNGGRSWTLTTALFGG